MQPKYETGLTFKVAKLSFVFAGAVTFLLIIAVGVLELSPF